MDSLLKSPFMEAIGEREFQRFQKQVESYNYYAGYQHVDPETGQLVKAKDLPRPPGLDYDPTRFEVNYFKRMIDAKAQWQMGGMHGISVAPQLIDNENMRLSQSYAPSSAQQNENERDQLVNVMTQSYLLDGVENESDVEIYMKRWGDAVRWQEFTEKRGY